MVENNEKMYLELLDFDTDKKEKWVKQRLPYSVLFELTARCNMNCVHCYLQNVHDTKELSYDKIIEIIDILYEKGIVFLTFTGGEILLRKDFVDIYLYAKKKGFLVELFTNGYLFDDKIIDALAEYPPLLVDISLYGASENTYRKVTGLQNAFARVIQNCKKLKKAGIRVSLKSPIIDLTYPEIKDMQMLADKLQIPFVYTFEICNTIDRQDMPKMHQISLNKALEYEFANHYKQIQTEGRKSKSNCKKIPVMTLNIDLEDSYRIGFIGIDDYKAGTCLAGLAHNLTRSGENILILSGSKTIHSQSQRVNGFLDTMKQYPEILLSNVIYTEDKLEISNKLLKEILSKKYYKTIVMVDSWLANAGEVVAQTGYNDINILGFDLMPQNKEALKQGKVTYIIDQSAYMQSYECVHKVCEHLIYGTELPKGKNYLPIHIYNKYNLD